MTIFESNKFKILNTTDGKNKIGYDIRVYKEYNSLAAACLINKAQSFSKKGDFGITDQEFSKILCLPLRSFKRAKKLIKDRFDMRIGEGNKTYYSLKKEIPYSSKHYRSFDVSHVSIMENSFKGGALLGQLLYWWNRALEKGEIDFSKTDNQIIEDLPFLSQDILTSIKKIAILKGFISIKRKKKWTEWGISHYSINPTRIEKSMKDKELSKDLERQKIIKELLDQQIMVCAKIPIECVPKSRLSVCQNPDSTIIIPINSSILSSKEGGKDYESNEEKERKKTNNFEEKQPNTEEGFKKEIYQMIGIWRDVVSPKEEIHVGNTLLVSLKISFEKKFNESLENWKEYCTLIADNEWLMGKNPSLWKARIHWGAKLENIDKVRMGLIYSKKKNISYLTQQKPVDLNINELIQEIDKEKDDEEIKKIKLSLINSFYNCSKDRGILSYHTYLRKAYYEIINVNDKKTLVIKSSYGAFNNLLPLHHILARELKQFNEVKIYGGSTDRNGNFLYMDH